MTGWANHPPRPPVRPRANPVRLECLRGEIGGSSTARGRRAIVRGYGRSEVARRAPRGARDSTLQVACLRIPPAIQRKTSDSGMMESVAISAGGPSRHIVEVRVRPCRTILWQACSLRGPSRSDAARCRACESSGETRATMAWLSVEALARGASDRARLGRVSSFAPSRTRFATSWSTSAAARPRRRR